MDGRYEWRKVDDMVVVRPKLAWNDADDPLNRSVRDVQVTDWLKIDVIDALVSFIYTNRFAPSHKFAALPSGTGLTFSGGGKIDLVDVEPWDSTGSKIFERARETLWRKPTKSFSASAIASASRANTDYSLRLSKPVE